MDQDYIYEQEIVDTRSFTIWFKVNDPGEDSYAIGGLDTKEYSKLKHNDQYTYEFVKSLIDSNKIHVHDGVIDCIWRSVDDVDYSKNKSHVWNYFTPINSSSARCNLCENTFKTSGNTSNLRAHLTSKHKSYAAVNFQEELKKRPVANVVQSSDAPNPKRLKTASGNLVAQQNPVIQMYQRAKSYEDGGIEAEKLTNSLLYMIAVDHMPLRITEKKGFQQFVRIATPRYTLPSRKTITNLLCAKYDTLKTKVINNLGKCSFYSITCDIWTDVTQKSYLGATVHYLSTDYLEIKSTNLCVASLNVEHTSHNISESLLTILNSFNLNASKITAVISDSAANMKKAISDTFGQSKGLPCFAHRISHIVPDAVSEMSAVKELIDKVKRIVTVTRRSVPASDELLRLQIRDGRTEGTSLRFIQSVETRWNSTFAMLERYLLLENYVYPVTSKCASPPPLLSHEETAILKDITNLMQSIAKVITEISGDTYLTCSIIIPIVVCMMNTIRQTRPMTPIGVEFKAIILRQMERRFSDIESYKILSISTILDPRFKKLHFQKAMSASQAIDIINRKMKSSISSNPVQTLQPSMENNKLQNNIWDYHDDLVKRTGAAKNNMDGLTFELKQYLSQPVISRTENPLKHWKLLQPSYPNLYNVATEYLCVVGTSVPCERLFSTAGNIKTDDRNRLSTDHLDKLLFLGSLSVEDWGL